jgi:hypothetical protein
MTVARAVAVAVTFVWLGMVLAISFIETPLKFRAPGVTVQIGLGIGRLVFRALNAVEIVLAVALGVAVSIDEPGGSAVVASAIAILTLVVQLVLVRPRLNRRSDSVLAGANGTRSHAHLGYVVLEILKVSALVAAGVLILAA